MIISRMRVAALVIGLSATLLYEVARSFYRPYIYANSLNDLHIADTIGNTLGTVAAVFMFVFLLGKERSQALFLIRTVTISLVVYELAHPLLGKNIDGWDVAATLLAGALCELIYRRLHAQPILAEHGFSQGK